MNDLLRAIRDAAEEGPAPMNYVVAVKYAHVAAPLLYTTRALLAAARAATDETGKHRTVTVWYVPRTSNAEPIQLPLD